jgi:hypothetical protein
MSRRSKSTTHPFAAVRAVVFTMAGVSLLASLSVWYRLQTIHGTLFGGLLFDPGMRFSDLRDIINAAASGIPYGAETATGTTYGPSYPPGAFLVGEFFSHLPTMLPRVILISLTATAVGALFGLVMLRSEDTRRKALAFTTGTTATVVGALTLDIYTLVLALGSTFAIVVLCVGWRSWTLTACVAMPLVGGLSFPIVFAIDRLNADLLVFQLMTLAVILLNARRGKLAAGAFGIAIAIKAYPVYFAAADPSRHGRWGRAAIALGTALALTAVAVANMEYGPHELVAAFQRSTNYFQQHYIIASEGLPYGASLFTAAVILHFKQGHIDSAAFAASLYSLWKPLSLVMTLGIAAIVMTFRIPAWSRLMVMVCAVITLSPNTGAYRETLLLIPLAMWLAAVPRDRGHRGCGMTGGIALGATLGIAFAPLTLFQVQWFEPSLNLTSHSILAPLAVSAVLVSALTTGLIERRRP